MINYRYEMMFYCHYISEYRIQIRFMCGALPNFELGSFSDILFVLNVPMPLFDNSFDSNLWMLVPPCTKNPTDKIG